MADWRNKVRRYGLSRTYSWLRLRQLVIVLACMIGISAAASRETPGQESQQESDRRRTQPSLPPQMEKSEGVRQKEAASRDKEGFRVGVDVNQVVVNVSVFDKSDETVTTLKQENFAIYEDKVLQTITNFGIADAPSTVGLAIDASGSMRQKLDFVVRAAKLFIDKSHPDNELFLVEFNDRANLVEEFTRDFDDIRDSLDNMIASGGTALYDAVYLAVEEANRGSESKKVLLVFSDGEDKDSHYKIDELLGRIGDSDVQVYMIIFVGDDLSSDRGFFGIRKSEKEKLQTKMAEIAEASGGKVYYPQKVEDLDQVFAKIATDLRNQYRIAYISANPVRDGKWREIRAQLTSIPKDAGYRLRTKRGYFAK